MSENTAGDSGTRGDSSLEPDAEAAEGAADDRPTVYDLAPDCTLEDTDVDALYHAEVNGIVDYGVFVDVSDAVSGLVHESNLDDDYAVGDRLVVRLTEVKPNGDVAFDDADLDDYRTETIAHEPTVSRVHGLSPGDEVTVEGEVVQAKQTGGPTIFAVADATGVLSCAAFEEAGVRAYPEVSVGDMVHVSGTVETRENALQLEVDSLKRLSDERAVEARERF
ncbi:OB-fold nucleic acid binding domain-containing protein, partial [Halorubrum pallidum]